MRDLVDWNTQMVFEEGGEIDFRAYDVLKTRIGRHLNKELGIRPTMVLTANPKKNWLYNMFYRTLEEWHLSPSRYVKFIQARYMRIIHILPPNTKGNCRVIS